MSPGEHSQDNSGKNISPGKLALVSLELGLVTAIIYLFSIEKTVGFVQIAPVIFGGFLVHSMLPFRLRLPFFFFLSILALFIALGPVSGGMLVAVGLGLVGICHLPIPYMIRVILIVLAGGFLAMLRANLVNAPQVRLMLPILGSMFMFRLIIYLYDLRHEKRAVGPWQRLSYFFLLPNACFPLFPVIDYQTYLRTYYARDALPIYQQGVEWMLRGIAQLILYRIVYYYLTPTPFEVEHFQDAILFTLSSYLLYLKISGLFHLIVGSLGLFGFDLPATHNWYFFSSSLTDFWRRINIYWKDFMTKVFFLPVFMRLRRLGMTPALIISTLVVFAVTWLLHSYQWFWLQGRFPISMVDGVFWGLLGVLVTLNTLFEAKRGRKRSLKGAAKKSLRAKFVLSFKTVLLFWFMCILWSFWGSESIYEWRMVFLEAREGTHSQIAMLVGAFPAMVLLGVALQFLRDRIPRDAKPLGFGRRVVVVASISLLVGALGLSWVRRSFPEPALEVLADLTKSKLNPRDRELIDRGYYEGLLNPRSLTSHVWEVDTKTKEDWLLLPESGAITRRNDILLSELKPSTETLHKGVMIRTNSLGMRDREYSRKKPPGTYRIALLGASYEMGVGVAGHRTFENLVENRLNQHHRSDTISNYEILNFSVGGYGVIQKVGLCMYKIFGFEPDAVFYMSHSNEILQSVKHFPTLLGRRTKMPRPLLGFIKQAHIQKGTKNENLRRFHPYARPFLRWGYRYVVTSSRRYNALPVWISVPLNYELRESNRLTYVPPKVRAEIARRQGFITMSLAGAYRNEPKDEITLSDWDGHPNLRGHRLLADKLYEMIIKNEYIMPNED